MFKTSLNIYFSAVRHGSKDQGRLGPRWNGPELGVRSQLPLRGGHLRRLHRKHPRRHRRRNRDGIQGAWTKQSSSYTNEHIFLARGAIQGRYPWVQGRHSSTKQEALSAPRGHTLSGTASPRSISSYNPCVGATDADFVVLIDNFYISSVLWYYLIHCLLSTGSLFHRWKYSFKHRAD